MFTQNLLKSTFSGGEWGPGMHSAFEVPRYSSACKEMTNMICRARGSAANRPGLKFVAEAHASEGNVRLLEFQFNVRESYVLEMGHHYIRVITNSGVVVDDLDNEVIITSVYEHTDLEEIRIEQSNDNVYLMHPSYPPYKLGRYSNTDWRFEEVNFGTSIAAPSGVRISDLGNYPLAESEDDETRWDMLVIAVDEDGKYSESSGSCSVYLSQTLSWNSVAGADYYRVYKAENGIYGWVSNVHGTTYKDPDQEGGTLPDMKVTAPVQKRPFDGDGNKPGLATTFKGRLTYGSTNNKPNGIFGSKAGDYENMNTSIPLGDSDAFNWNVLSSKMNRITWLCEYGDDLIIGTEGGVRRHSCGGESLKPDNPKIIPEKTKGGCANIKPMEVGGFNPIYSTGASKSKRFCLFS